MVETKFVYPRGRPRKGVERVPIGVKVIPEKKPPGRPRKSEEHKREVIRAKNRRIYNEMKRARDIVRQIQAGVPPQGLEGQGVPPQGSD